LTRPDDDAAAEDAVLEALVLSVPPIAPRPHVRRELLARIAAEPREAPEGFFTVKPGVTGVRTSTAAWIASPIPGIEYKLIARDAGSGMRTQLVRFAAGARYPRHRHAGTEEIFLLEGSVRVNGVELRAGDYCRSEPGTEEIGTYSETGGLALIVSSERDDVEVTAP
jgi:quercetin dioxygenase-like cupin family protein